MKKLLVFAFASMVGLHALAQSGTQRALRIDRATGEVSTSLINFTGTVQFGGSAIADVYLEEASNLSDLDDASTARTNLGLALGTDVQEYSAILAAIAAGTWTGASSITTLGTITTGTWTGTDIAVADGGTGASDASGARTNLGLVIGTDVQAWSAYFDDLAAITPAKGDAITFDGSDWVKVDASGASDGDVPTIQADGSLAFETPAVGASAINDLTDVTIAGASKGDIIWHTGTNWADLDASGASDGDVPTIQADGSLAFEAPPGAGGGETNTASSSGTGVSLYYQKTGVDLEFNAIKSENTGIDVSLDAISHDIELTLQEANIDLSNCNNTTSAFITASSSDTLTNKTIDADGTGNSITNIENADIKALAAIDATKIADGTVTSAEFQYIGGLTSDAQGQLNAKKETRTGVYRTIWIDAGAMVSRTTNGAAFATEEYTTSDVMSDHYLFDTTTSEAVQFRVSMPDAWDRSTIKYKIYWDAATGASASDQVSWGVRAAAVGNDDAIDGSWGTAQTVDDVAIAVGDLHVSPASSALTVGGTPALGDVVTVEVYRNVSGNDDMAEDAKLLGVKIQYGESSTEPSAW